MILRELSRRSKRKLRSFPPVVSRKCKLLILGTMPGVASLAKRQYYGNPRNAFWEFIFNLTGENAGDDYLAKKNILLRYGIALWDVLKTCERQGSLDSGIRCEKPNSFRKFFARYPNIHAVFFNGTPARQFYKKHVGFHDGIRFFVLPSTSPTPGKYNKSKEEKLKAWLQLRDCLEHP